MLVKLVFILLTYSSLSWTKTLPLKDYEQHGQTVLKVRPATLQSWTVLFAHGLGEGTKQFDPLAQRLNAVGYNTVQLVLSGHKESPVSPDKTQIKNWISDIDIAFERAQRLGQGVIFVGHSTGAALMLLHRVRNSQPLASAQAMVLFEPAIRVRSLTTWGACVGDFLGINDNVKIRALAKKYGIFKGTLRDRPPHVNLALGCMVHRLRPLLLENYRERQSRRDLSPEAWLAESTSVPTLVFNNPRDLVVSYETNQRYCKALHALGRGACAEVPSPMVHGQALDDKELAQGFARQLLEFIGDHLDSLD